MALAKARMRELSMSFEKYTEMIIKCFSTLDTDEDGKLSNQQKVNAIIHDIRVQDV